MSIFGGYTQKRRRVKLLTAGDDLFLLCPPANIDLDAVLNDTTNLRNHTLEWVQTSGPAVALFNTDNLSTGFVHNNTQDKTFKFYLDRDTNREQVKEVNLQYTPTSVQKGGGMFLHETHLEITTPNISRSDSFLFPPALGVENANLSVDPINKFSWSGINSLWGLAGKEVLFELLKSTVYTHNPTDVVESHLAGSFPTFVLVQAGVYKVRITYDFDGMEPKTFLSPLFIAYPVEAGSSVGRVIDEVVNHAQAINLQTLNIIRLSVKKQTLSVTNLSSKQAISLDTLNLLRYTVKKANEDSCPGLESNFGLPGYANNEYLNLVRLDPSGIGGS